MTAPPDRDRPRFSLLRLLPLLVLAAGLVAFFALGLDQVVSLEALRQNRAELTRQVAAQPLAAPLVFIAVYTLATAFSLPVGALLTVAGGFLFGPWLGTLSVVIGATLGAAAVFLAARSALGEPLRARAGPNLQRLQAGFAENALSYLLFLRLVPVFPFWLVNLAPALLGVPLSTFVIGTFVGIVPGTFVFAYVGQGLGSILDSGGAFSLGSVLTFDIVVALVLLALLSLLPAAYKRLRRRQGAAGEG